MGTPSQVGVVERVTKADGRLIVASPSIGGGRNFFENPGFLVYHPVYQTNTSDIMAGANFTLGSRGTSPGTERTSRGKVCERRNG